MRPIKFCHYQCGCAITYISTPCFRWLDFVGGSPPRRYPYIITITNGDRSQEGESDIEPCITCKRFKARVMKLKSRLDCDPLLPATNTIDAEMPAVSPERKPVGWRCIPYILGIDACEKLASNALSVNLMLYLGERYGMAPVAATKIGFVFGGTTNFTPLFGAYIADAYWGRFRTLAFGSLVTFLGMVLWTVASLVPQLQSRNCTQMAQQSGQCTGPTKMQLSFLYLAMGMLALGAGGIRPCTLPFGVDQFDTATEQDKRSLNSFFNLYYFNVTAATMISMTILVYIQDIINWSLGFGIPTCLMLFSVLFFFFGRRLYVNVPPEGSVFSSIAQVFVASYKKRKLQLPPLDGVEQQGSLFHDPPFSDSRTIKLPLSQQFRFLNKAAIICESESSLDDSLANRWKLCSIQQIEEVKCLMRIMPIWASSIIVFLTISQQWSFAVLQSLKMDRHLGPNFQIPAASMASIGMFACIVFIPIYDRILVPAMRRITKIEGGITLLERQGVGMVITTLSMYLTAMVEKMRRDSALSNHGVSPISVLWLIPQIGVMGIGESLSAVGQVEFYNRQVPENMKTLAGSLFCLSQAGASYVTSLMVIIIQKTTGGDGRKNWLDDDINEVLPLQGHVTKSSVVLLSNKASPFTGSRTIQVPSLMYLILF